MTGRGLTIKIRSCHKMSMVQVISHSGGGLAADRTPFYGIKLPPEVKKLVQLSKKIEHGTIRKILKCKKVVMSWN